VSGEVPRFENSRNVETSAIRVLPTHLQHAVSTFSEFRKRGFAQPTQDFRISPYRDEFSRFLTLIWISFSATLLEVRMLL
jgi:hypothetical protein